MDIQTRLEYGIYIVSVAGRMDATTSYELDVASNIVIDQKPQKVLLDFSQLEYASSAGLRVILIISKRFKQQGIEFGFIGLKGMVYDVFKISGFLSLFSIYENLEQARG